MIKGAPIPRPKKNNVVNPNIIDLIEDNKYLDMPDFIDYCNKHNKRLIVYPVHEYWLDIGRKESLEMAKNNWPVD